MKKNNGEDLKGVLNKKKLKGYEEEGYKDVKTVYEDKLVNYAPASKKYKKIKPFDTSKMGRPKVYGDDSPVWEYLIDQITHGRSLSSVLREDDMPYLRVFQIKLERDEKFRALYEKAVQDRADRLADEIMDLADEALPTDLGAGANAWVQNKRVQVEARKWIASKLKPRTYGDRLDVSVTDNRISVLGALEQAQKRVALGMSDPNVLDVNVKTVEQQREVVTITQSRMDAQELDKA